MVPTWLEPPTLQEIENSGNEARKYLKTKESHFLNAANSAHFARKLAQIGPQKEQKQRILRETNRS
jgi:hypothetical protein